MTVPETLSDQLAKRGLVPNYITVPALSPDHVAQARRWWTNYADRANEHGWSVVQVAGVVAVCIDMIASQGDPDLVNQLRPLIANQELTVEETLAHAHRLLAYLTADRPAAAA